MHYRARFSTLYFVLLVTFAWTHSFCDSNGDYTTDDDDDDDDNDDDNFALSVDGDTRLEEMSNYESYLVCKDIAKGFNEILDHETQCLRVGIAVGEGSEDNGEEACSEAYAGCMKGDETDYQTCDKYKETSDKYEECDARVELMENCIRETLEQLEEAYDGLTCASSGMEDPDELPLTDACEEMEEQCPGVATNFERLY